MGLYTVAGVGGISTALFVIVVFFGFYVNQAMAIGNLIILCCALTRYLYTLNWKHPNKPYVVLVDYSAATILLGITLIGN